MLAYYFSLGLRKLRSNPALTALMVLTLAVGVAASVSTLSILQLMSADPMPSKSKLLFVPVIDNGLMKNYQPGAKPDDVQMSYRDARNLLAQATSTNSGNSGIVRRVALYGLNGALEANRSDLPASHVGGIATHHDYFAMFEAPFLYGSAWSAQDDANGAAVVVLSRKQSEVLYGKRNPVGKTVRYMDHDFLIVGVLNEWRLMTRFPHLINGSGGHFNGEENIYMPLQTSVQIQAGMEGSMTCTQETAPGYQGLLDSECTWVQFWFELASAADAPQLQNYLNAYVSEQKKLGRLQRPDAVKIYDVMQWMELLNVVKSDSKLTVWLAFGFLALCLVNTMGLLLAKFSVRASEVGVRRALGASRAEIFKQFLSEAAVVGLAGGVLGLPLSLVAMQFIATSSADIGNAPGMNWFMFGTTFVLSVAASVLAGLLPTWRACQITPALQLKSQ
ncbi:MAG: ABC transporter permease [Burkholderiales bacterium]|nr:ABC transporter permease [Burkholderiales bacterium]